MGRNYTIRTGAREPFLPYPFTELAVTSPLAERVGMTFGHEPARRDLPGGKAATAPPSAAAPDPPALAVSRVRPAAAEPHFLDQLGRDLAHDREGLGQVSMRYAGSPRSW